MLTIFFTLLEKLISLYFLIFLGFLAGKLLHVKKESIASLLIYVIAPAVFFSAIITAEIDLHLLALPLLFFSLSTSICLLIYQIASRFWKSPTRNILAFCSGSANVGYFGIPVGLVLFGEKALGLIVLAGFGFILFESTLGFFITARGHHAPSESLKRVLRVPTFYAFALGVILNFLHYHPNQQVLNLGLSFRGAYSVLGMMLIGLGLTGLEKLKLDFKFIGFSFLVKFLLWPTAVISLVYFDRSVLHYFGENVHRVMILMSIVPLPANSVAIATELRADPDKAATAVLASTLFALFYIPAISLVFLNP